MHDVLTTSGNSLHFDDRLGGAPHTDMIINHGVDLEIPGGSAMIAPKVKGLLEKGVVSEADVDKKVLNILHIGMTMIITVLSL